MASNSAIIFKGVIEPDYSRTISFDNHGVTLKKKTNLRRLIGNFLDKRKFTASGSYVALIEVDNGIPHVCINSKYRSNTAKAGDWSKAGDWWREIYLEMKRHSDANVKELSIKPPVHYYHSFVKYLDESQMDTEVTPYLI